MDKFIEFHIISSKERSTLEFSVQGEKGIALQVQKEKSNKLATAYLTSKREFEVLEDMCPDDVSLVIHDGEKEKALQGDNHIYPYSDQIGTLKKAMTKKHLKIAVLDPFVFEKRIMSLLEYQIRIIRILLAKKNIACTFYKVYGVNSANYQSYKNESFVLFEGNPFPVSILELNKFDMVLNLENIMDGFDPKVPFFDAVNQFIVDFKP